MLTADQIVRNCPMCLETKANEAFYRNAARTNGLSVYCKECTKQNQKERDKTPERKEQLREANRRYYAQHTEARKESSRKWRLENPAQNRAQSARWFQENPDKVRARNAYYRSLKHTTIVDPVDYSLVVERSAGMCGICGKPLNLLERWPHTDSVSVDHIIALTKGGTHTYENLQAAHLGCNIRKGNS